MFVTFWQIFLDRTNSTTKDLGHFVLLCSIDFVEENVRAKYAMRIPCFDHNATPMHAASDKMLGSGLTAAKSNFLFAGPRNQDKGKWTAGYHDEVVQGDRPQGYCQRLLETGGKSQGQSCWGGPSLCGNYVPPGGARRRVLSGLRPGCVAVFEGRHQSHSSTQPRSHFEICHCAAVLAS